MPQVLVLPSELNIIRVAALRDEWLAWLAGLEAGAAPALDGSAVDDVDAAGVQLLAALERSLAARGLGWRLATPSAALCEACRALGLSGLLAAAPLPAAGVAA